MVLGETLNQDRWKIITAMFRGADVTVEQLVGVFFTNAQSSLEQIRAGLDQNRRDWCVSAGHSLKSSSANLGLERISVLCHQLEDNALAMSSGELDQMILTLGVELGQARRAISAQMEEIL